MPPQYHLSQYRDQSLYHFYFAIPIPAHQHLLLLGQVQVNQLYHYRDTFLLYDLLQLVLRFLHHSSPYEQKSIARLALFLTDQADHLLLQDSRKLSPFGLLPKDFQVFLVRYFHNAHHYPTTLFQSPSKCLFLDAKCLHDLQQNRKSLIPLIHRPCYPPR